MFELAVLLCLVGTTDCQGQSVLTNDCVAAFQQFNSQKPDNTEVRGISCPRVAIVIEPAKPADKAKPEGKLQT